MLIRLRYRGAERPGEFRRSVSREERWNVGTVQTVSRSHAPPNERPFANDNERIRLKRLFHSEVDRV